MLVNRKDDEAMRYYRQGASVAEIATMQGRSQDAVRESLDQVAYARQLLQVAAS